MDKVGAGNWANFKNLMKDAHDTFNQATIVWRRYQSLSVNQDFNEEKSDVYTEVTLKVLVGYNYFRTWPITKHTTAGELDNQNMVVMINREYLQGLGFISPQGYFTFDAANDKFVHLGIVYKVEGDTPLSQAPADPLHIHLILRREEHLEGTNRFNQ